MQNTLLVQTYPEKIVPPIVMKYAESLYDILDCIRCDFVDNTLVLYYVYNGTLVKLGHCSLLINGNQCVISNFYTANLAGIDESFKPRTSAATDIHVLQSPIKYLGRQMFAKIFDVCHENAITSLQLAPLKHTNSSVFYHKMILYYPDDIISISDDEQGNIVFMLK
ncbi:MAG TPA: hypothetical protein PKC87_06115 [Candidatus Absconditabacterales bacterium]|nr:hypothetical protein [Candidatus Absconditabacterales bacterium]